MQKVLSALWLVPLVSLLGSASAQNRAPESTDAIRPSAGYRSAFEGYKPYSDDKLLNWKDANENTARIGGWRTYAKEARQTEEKVPPAPGRPEAKPGSEKP
jgi:hypothetical protein